MDEHSLILGRAFGQTDNATDIGRSGNVTLAMAKDNGTVSQIADYSAHTVEYPCNGGIGPASFHHGATFDNAGDTTGNTPGRSQCAGIGAVNNVSVGHQTHNPANVFAGVGAAGDSGAVSAQ